MRKLVNGKVIDIKNIELFELAAEGLLRQSKAVSKTGDGITGTVNSDLIKNYIKQYDIFFKSMPYPLYAIEADIKYATLANFIKRINRQAIRMWVNKGLYIQLDKETLMTLHVVNNTWSIVYTKCEEDNTLMESFAGSIGYEEYSWLLNKILNRESTANYYETFMPDFLDACKHNDMVIKWELENILNFGKLPKRIELVDNKITDISNNCEYILDTYVTKTVDSEDKVTTWDLTKTSRVGSLTANKQIKIYGFDVYTKSLSNEAYRFNDMSEKLTKVSIPGMQSMFVILSGIKNAQDRKNFPVYRGFILDHNLVFSVDKSLYVTKSNKITEAKEVARGIEIYGVDRNNVYFLKSKRLQDSLTRESIYSYNLADGSIKLCSIRFRY